jgi:hypothetical protein
MFCKKSFGDGFALTGNASEFLDPVFFRNGFCYRIRNAGCKIGIKTTERRKIDWQTEYTDYILYGVDVFTTYVKEWYTGNLQELFFHQPENPDVKKNMCCFSRICLEQRQSFCEKA